MKGISSAEGRTVTWLSVRASSVRYRCSFED